MHRHQPSRTEKRIRWTSEHIMTQIPSFPAIYAVAGVALTLAVDEQSSGLVRHVFRLLQDAKEKHRPVPWVLLENVLPTDHPSLAELGCLVRWRHCWTEVPMVCPM